MFNMLEGDSDADPKKTLANTLPNRQALLTAIDNAFVNI